MCTFSAWESLAYLKSVINNALKAATFEKPKIHQVNNSPFHQMGNKPAPGNNRLFKL